MLSAVEIRAALKGLFLLLRFDAGFVNWFDRSPAGARRSFRLMLPLLPLTIARLFMVVDAAPDVSPIIVATSVVTYYVLGWIAFPLLLILVGRALEREPQAIGALSAYNWLGFTLSIAAFVLALLGLSEALREIADFLLMALVLASLVYEAFLLNTLTGIGYFGAGLLAVIDYIVAQSLLIVLLIAPKIMIPVA
ncbi:MAG: hypothetical protein HYU58_12600 [Proteobacteria bacterium]|nr:hypothetical protein [Pseudomonadota bacterium]